MDAERLACIRWGRTLREERVRLGWKQAELARRVGVCRHAVLFWESGAFTPTLLHAKRLATALGVTLDALASTLPAS